MRRLVGILAVAAALLASGAPAGAGDYGPAIWCDIVTTGLPGGTVNQRVAISGFMTDPATNIAGYLVVGVEAGVNADLYGYGHTSPGLGFPITISVTGGPTIANPMVRLYRYDVQANFTATTRITDINTSGTFTATGLSSLQCIF